MHINAVSKNADINAPREKHIQAIRQQIQLTEFFCKPQNASEV